MVVGSKGINVMLRRFLAAAAAAVFVTSAFAQEYQVGPIKIELPWTRAMPTGARVAGGFMKIENTGSEPDRLVGGSLISAGHVEIHEMAMVDNVMKMQELAAGIEIKPRQSIELKPGSYHVMFMDMTATLKEGEKVKGTLRFEKAGTIEVEYAVRAMGSSQGGNSRPPPLAMDIGGPFELTTQDGTKLSSRQLLGRPFAVFFGFTFCPDACPTTLLGLTNVLQQLGPAADRMRYLFISVDTERDTPEQLKIYLSSFDPRITGLTGTAEQIAFVAKAYHAYYEKVPTKGGFTYNHTALIYLMDGNGRFAGTITYEETEAVQIAKLKRLLGLTG
jgi:protein SCO1